MLLSSVVLKKNLVYTVDVYSPVPLTLNTVYATLLETCIDGFFSSLRLLE